ncbi:hypothetical protein BGZ76_005582, partial [Entomortierella beljakovae]
MSDFFNILGSMALGAVGLWILLPVLLSSMGFGPGGIVEKTKAAKRMSKYGGVVASGSLFATLQSLGAVGPGAAAKVVTIGVGALIGAALYMCPFRGVAFWLLATLQSLGAAAANAATAGVGALIGFAFAA